MFVITKQHNFFSTAIFLALCVFTLICKFEPTCALNIGLIVDQKGDYSSNDKNVQTGVFLWKKWLDETSPQGIKIGENTYDPVTIEIFDSAHLIHNFKNETQVIEAVKATTRKIFYETNITAIIGPWTTVRTMAILDELMQLNNNDRSIMLFPTGGTSTSLYRKGADFIYLNNPHVDEQQTKFFEQLYNIGIRSGSLIWKEGDALSRSLMQAISNNSRDPKYADFTWLKNESYAGGTNKDFIISLRNTLLNDNTINQPQDAIFICALGADIKLVTALVTSLKPQNVKMLVYPAQLSYLTSTTDLYENARYWISNQLFNLDQESGQPGKYMGTTQEWADYYFKTYNKKPEGSLDVRGCSAAIVLQMAVEVAKTDDPKALRKVMLEFEGQPQYDTFYGVTAFNEEGWNDKRYSTIVQIHEKDGFLQPVPIVKKLEYPAPFDWLNNGNSTTDAEADGDGDDEKTIAIAVIVPVVGVILILVVIIICVVVILILFIKLKFHVYLLKKE